MTWWMWLLVAWGLVSGPVAFVLGRGIRTADRLARPQIVSAPRIGALRTTTSDDTSPDAGGPSQRPESALLTDAEAAWRRLPVGRQAEWNLIHGDGHGAFITRCTRAAHPREDYAP